jgi:hypothetical protein
VRLGLNPIMVFSPTLAVKEKPLRADASGGIVRHDFRLPVSRTVVSSLTIFCTVSRTLRINTKHRRRTADSRAVRLENRSQQALREMQFEVICSEARGAAVRRRSSEAGHHNAIPPCCNGPSQAADSCIDRRRSANRGSPRMLSQSGATAR